MCVDADAFDTAAATAIIAPRQAAGGPDGGGTERPQGTTSPSPRLPVAVSVAHLRLPSAAAVGPLPTRMGADGRRYRSASVLKPLLFWAAAWHEPYRWDREGWADQARPAVTVSDNAATTAMCDTVGQDVLLDRLACLTGVAWHVEPDSPRSFIRVLITADELAAGYAKLAAAAGTGDEAATDLLTWMRQVPEPQTFGTRAVVATELGADPASVAVTCGWFAHRDETVIRTHAVTVARAGDGAEHVTAVLTAVPLSATAHTDYERAYDGGQDVTGVHQDFAGHTVRAGTVAALRGGWLG
jgi:hypothetical protein